VCGNILVDSISTVFGIGSININENRIVILQYKSSSLTEETAPRKESEVNTEGDKTDPKVFIASFGLIMVSETHTKTENHEAQPNNLRKTDSHSSYPPYLKNAAIRQPTSQIPVAIARLKVKPKQAQISPTTMIVANQLIARIRAITINQTRHININLLFKY
jgi:hypothetical protein